MPRSPSISGDLRSRVAQRAGCRCEYCLLAEDDSGYRHQVDHIISRKHGGDSTEDNLAFACAVCNRNKGTDVAALSSVSGRPVSLFNPRRQAWHDHFRFDGPHVRSLTETGEVTIRVLRLNDPWRVRERAVRSSTG